MITGDGAVTRGATRDATSGWAASKSGSAAGTWRMYVISAADYCRHTKKSMSGERIVKRERHAHFTQWSGCQSGVGQVLATGPREA
jgi:hypothetical protein